MKNIYYIFVAMICLSFNAAASAQSLEALGASSKFINNHYKNLKKNNANTVYAAQETKCPSRWWYNGSSGYNESLIKDFKNDISRKMSVAGFDEDVIKKCIKSGAFVFKNLVLQNHKKNKSYSKYVQPGVMLIRNKSTGMVSEMPVLVETWSYSGDPTLKIYNSELNEVCSTKPDGNSIKGYCKSYGELYGSSRQDSNGRVKVNASNEKWDIGVYTNVTRGNALRQFAD